MRDEFSLVGAAGIEPTTSSPPDLRDTTTLRPVNRTDIIARYLATCLTDTTTLRPVISLYTHAVKNFNLNIQH